VKKSWMVGFIAALLIAACQSAAPLHQFIKGDVLSTNDFSKVGSFEEGAYGAATLQVIDGTYQINVMQGDNVLWWGQWGDTYKDTVVEVDTSQQGDTNQNAYGVMCRVQGTVGQKQPVDPALAAILQDSTPEATAVLTAESTLTGTAEATAEATPQATAEATAETQPLLTATPSPTAAPVSSGDGYLFLIQGGGQFSIMRSRGRNLTPLVNWTSSDVIKQGAATNHLRAICAGTYLAFYINDTFVGDATDDSYNSGQVGLAASSANRAGTRISFDNLSVANVVAK
jgi:hypothetical protein